MTRIDELDQQIAAARADICELCLPTNGECGADEVDVSAEILEIVDKIVKLSIEREYWVKKRQAK